MHPDHITAVIGRGGDPSFRYIAPERLDDLTCPIGIPGIEGKHPAAIAASVAAQILQVRETRMAIGHATHPGPDVPPLSSLPRPQ